MTKKGPGSYRCLFHIYQSRRNGRIRQIGRCTASTVTRAHAGTATPVQSLPELATEADSPAPIAGTSTRTLVV